LSTAKASVPPPPAQPYDPATANRNLQSITDPVEYAQQASADRAAFAAQQKAHQEAAQAVESYDQTVTQTAAAQPAFAPAPPAPPPNTDSSSNQVGTDSSPNKTNRSTTKWWVSLRMRLREGPVQLAARLGIAPSTVRRILTSARLNRLSRVDRATGEPIRRYEHPHPGALIHVDVKKGGNIPDGGGWRYVGRPQGRKNRAATPGKAKNKWRGPKMGYAFVHTVIDDHSRVAYAEIHDDETATGVLHRAVEWFSDRGVTVERVLSDNGSAYRSHLWRDTCEALAIKPKRTRRTVRRPTARSSGSTAPWPTDGPTPAAIGPSTSVERHSLPGSITTTTIGRTPPAPTSRPSRD
jgi:hypothetical protein